MKIHKTQRGKLNSLTCRGSRWKAKSLRHSSTPMQQELCCSTDHTGSGALFSACLSFPARRLSLPGAAEIRSCSRSRRSLSLLHHHSHRSALRSLRIRRPLCLRGWRSAWPSRGGPPQTAGQTKRSVGKRERLGQVVFELELVQLLF